MKDNDVVMVSACRTPFSRFESPMTSLPSIDLAMVVMKEVIGRVGLDPKEVEEIYYGSCVVAEFALETDVPARQASLLAGFPAEVFSVTLDRACCSSLTTLRLGMMAMRAEGVKVVMSVGSENMPRTPHLAPGLRSGTRIGHIKLVDLLFELGYKAKGFNSVAVDAGEVAVEHGVTREMQDEWAVRSHERCLKAYEEGRIKVGEELTPVVVPQAKGEPVVIDRDECPRRTTREALAKLRPVYGSPTVTAGNAPPISAGSSAILLMTREEARKRGLEPLATVVAAVSAATEPRGIAVIPAFTIQKALDRAGLSLDDMALMEINEAFAAMPLVSTKILAGGDEGKWRRLQEITNVNGGAVAIGHPVGASAGRITMTLAYELRRRGGGYGVASICGGLAQGEAVIIKV
ncbi:MAG TPA: thiolase family protein [Syntrophales bacterium]|nr:thiolase family protein [Syntrophales bacterium]HOM06639.1 thiolase family protein [Syntrophales bacterium]HON99789.1 thiolase family protein [Syntrophales bacterium]HPC01143.1 thiolase family protein [Syntrophales bacterium]HPQ06300.1 thiolase family protein [Syntrophales bacterium]